MFGPSFYYRFQDWYHHMKEAELTHKPNWLYMKSQPDIDKHMRAVLVDWLVDVVKVYKMETETLNLAISYIDRLGILDASQYDNLVNILRFLSSMSVERGKLQLVGTTCLFIAAKYEEVYPPKMAEFVDVTDGACTKKQVV